MPRSVRNTAHHRATWNKPVWWLAALLAALATLGPFSIDTYLPAFDGIAASLDATPVQMQQTLSGYLLGFAVMMLFHGALADSFGRRRVVLIGLTAFALASVVCATATHIGTLVIGRALQGMSAGAGIVVGRAIVRDIFDAADAQRLMSQITLFFGVAPAIAPIIGGWVFTLAGWRAVFWFLALVPALLIALAWFTLPETLPADKRQAFSVRSLTRGYLGILGDRRFLLMSIASGVPFNGMFVFILAAPTLLGHHLHLPPTQFFWLFVCGIGGIMGGAFVSGRLAGRVSREKQVRWGFTILLTLSASNALWHYFLPATPVSAILPVGMIAFGWALLTPVVTLMVMDRFPERLGMASSLQAFIGSLTNAVVAGVVAPIAMHSVEGLATASFLMGLTGWVAWRLYRRDVKRSASPA